MGKLVNLTSSRKSRLPRVQRGQRPSQPEAEDAVRTLIRWAGDDPDREGLKGTPGRVVRAYKEWFSGYDEDPNTLRTLRHLDFPPATSLRERVRRTSQPLGLRTLQSG